MSINLVLLILGIILFLFIYFHCAPLSDDQIIQLSKKRRNFKIETYHTFNNSEFNVCKDFKKRMNPNGKFYKLDEKLRDFPSVASALLKYKKHEWIVVAFEKNKEVSLIWLNKGISREAVSLNLSVNDLTTIASENDYSTVLIFHNHPNSNPSEYDCSNPSEQDINSAKVFAKELNEKGVNLIEFICERGMHHKYFSSYADNFIPIDPIINEIKLINGISKMKNFSLQMESLF
ncbi:MAG: hypothetical protein ACPG5R_08585 [Cognaticolwellia aestuarii]